MAPPAESPGRSVVYLAVLPFYRQSFVEALNRAAPGQVVLFAGKQHIDESVVSGIEPRLYTLVRNRVIAGRVLLQTGHLPAVIRAPSVIVDLNPRSVTAWAVLIVRKFRRGRTLVWGHLHPRLGAQSRTAQLRRFMRRMADGTVLYGYDSVLPARTELPASPVWVAPNSLYRSDRLTTRPTHGPYDTVLFVGRLVKEKKVDVLIRGFALSRLRSSGARLVIVGDGSRRDELSALGRELRLGNALVFHGPETDGDRLKLLYERAVCSVSPGYVGLSLTQSLGFGVPVVVSRDEPHSPEIELTRFGGVSYFDTDSAESLASELDALPKFDPSDFRTRLSNDIAKVYSAEAMAEGLLRALADVPQELGDDGWPSNS